MDGPIMVYSMKVNANELAEAKKFFARSGLQLQVIMRSMIRIAASCEACLQLVEAKAPVSQIQSSFASILADAKETWRLNGLFQEVMLKAAEECHLPAEFITNVLGEAQRTYQSSVESLPKEEGKDKGI